MKKILTTILLFATAFTFGQSAAGYTTLTKQSANIGKYLLVNDTGAARASAAMEVRSTAKGFLPPRMTNTQRNAISSPTAGLMIYSTDDALPEVYRLGAWTPLCYFLDSNNFWKLHGNAAAANSIMGTTNGTPLVLTEAQDSVSLILKKTSGIRRANLSTDLFSVSNRYGYNLLTTQISDTSTHIYRHFIYTDGNESAHKVLTSDANGLATWQTPSGGTLPIVIFPDSLTGFNLQANYFNTIGDTLKNIVAASDTFYFPNGANGDVIEIKCSIGFMGGSVTFVGNGCYVNSSQSLVGMQYGAYCKWTFHNGKWY